MMRCALLFFALFTILVPVSAQADNKGALCNLLPVEMKPAPADYVPGVDVNGNAVVPADLTARQMMAGVDFINLPVTMDLAQTLGQSLPPGTEMKAQVAMAEIHNDGTVLFGGQDVTQKAYAICGKMPPATASEKVEVIEVPAAPVAVEEDDDTIIWGKGY